MFSSFVEWQTVRAFVNTCLFTMVLQKFDFYGLRRGAKMLKRQQLYRKCFLAAAIFNIICWLTIEYHPLRYRTWGDMKRLVPPWYAFVLWSLPFLWYTWHVSRKYVEFWAAVEVFVDIVGEAAITMPACSFVLSICLALLDILPIVTHIEEGFFIWPIIHSVILGGPVSFYVLVSRKLLSEQFTFTRVDATNQEEDEEDTVSEDFERKFSSCQGVRDALTPKIGTHNLLAGRSPRLNVLDRTPNADQTLRPPLRASRPFGSILSTDISMKGGDDS
eukprot:GEMP01060169.1.p1 GENE.GEMP01060169.1~~GEMP01060169.1.p1  ORF type:complete len:275 (+),score=39.54 GEMP01060169.1:149-973(+)